MDPDAQQDRLKRLRMRCWRRGTREMDLILGPFADACAAGLKDTEIAALERALEENDQDLYAWICGREAPPSGHLDLVRQLRSFHNIR